LQATIEDAYLHLLGGQIPAERWSVDATIVFLGPESLTEITEKSAQVSVPGPCRAHRGHLRPA
jgi:hypothetical protein